MMVRFRFLFALLTQIHKMVEVNLTEDDILLVFFICFYPEKYSDEKVGSRQGKLAYRVKQEKEE
jgi:hypothetical protein